MGVIRVERNKNFTHMANYHLRDRDLSLRAVGLMSKMLSLPEDWDYTVAGLASICKEGREAVRKTLQELEAAGYLVRQQGRAGGKFAGADYVLFEKPGTLPPMPGNLGNGEAPMPGNPVTGNPVPDIPPQVNTKDKVQKDPPKAPQGAGADYEPKKAPDWKPERWEKFWAFYPLHKSKQAAIKAWDKLKPSDELLAVIGKALVRQIAEKQAECDRRRIPFEWKIYASSYLNGARWTDEEDEVDEIDGTPRASAPTGERRDLLWI